jgi:hypothetical protein
MLGIRVYMAIQQCESCANYWKDELTLSSGISCMEGSLRRQPKRKEWALDIKSRI